MFDCNLVDPQDYSLSYAALFCRDEWQEYDCPESIALCILFFLTVIVCLIQIIRLIKSTGRAFSYQQIVLYLGLLESLLGVIHWLFVPETSMLFPMSYLSMVQIMVICYYFLHSAFRMFGLKHYTRRILWPAFTLAALFFTAMLVVGLLGVDNNSSIPCKDPVFIVFSSGSFGFTILFTVSGLVMLRKLESKSISKNMWKQKKRHLAFLVSLFSLTTFVSFTYDLVDTVFVRDISQCDLFLEEYPAADTAVKFFLRAIVLVVPIWATALAFNTVIREKQSTASRPLARLAPPGLNPRDRLEDHAPLLGEHAVPPYPVGIEDDDALPRSVLDE